MPDVWSTQAVELSWLDSMPLIPFARGVPGVLPVASKNKAIRRFIVIEALDEAVHVAYDSGDCEVIYADDPRWPKLRVDLDEPQGFGYVLRWYQHKTQTVDERHGRLVMYWLDHTIEDNDRLLLASFVRRTVSRD